MKTKLGATQKTVLAVLADCGGATNIWHLCRLMHDHRGIRVPRAVARLRERGIVHAVRQTHEYVALNQKERRALERAMAAHPRAYSFVVLSMPSSDSEIWEDI